MTTTKDKLLDLVGKVNCIVSNVKAEMEELDKTSKDLADIANAMEVVSDTDKSEPWQWNTQTSIKDLADIIKEDITKIFDAEYAKLPTETTENVCAKAVKTMSAKVDKPVTPQLPWEKDLLPPKSKKCWNKRERAFVEGKYVGYRRDGQINIRYLGKPAHCLGSYRGEATKFAVDMEEINKLVNDSKIKVLHIRFVSVDSGQAQEYFYLTTAVDHGWILSNLSNLCSDKAGVDCQPIANGTQITLTTAEYDWDLQENIVDFIDAVYGVNLVAVPIKFRQTPDITSKRRLLEFSKGYYSAKLGNNKKAK